MYIHIHTHTHKLCGLCMVMLGLPVSLGWFSGQCPRISGQRLTVVLMYMYSFFVLFLFCVCLCVCVNVSFLWWVSFVFMLRYREIWCFP